MEILFSSEALKAFKDISKGDKKTAGRITETIKQYSENPAGNFDIKKLSGQHGDIMRLRIGNYRILFDLTKDAMTIYKIKHRREAYR